MLKHTRGESAGALRPILTGLLVATVCFFLFMLITSAVLFLGDDPTYKSELWSFGAMLISGAVAGFINAKLRGDGGVLIATLSALVLILILFIVGVIFVGLPSLASITNYVIYVAVSALAAFFASQKPKKRRRR